MATTSRNVAEAFARAFQEAGGTYVFGVPGGGSNLDVVGAVERAGCTFVLTHTENAAGMMASAVAELTGDISAAIATRGPGATSITNGSAQALLDRQPVLIVTDCVNQGSAFRNSHQRLDQHSLFASLAKASVTLGDGDTQGIARAAIANALDPMPGPIHFDIDPTTTSTAPDFVQEQVPTSAEEIEAIRDLFAHAKNPIVILGVGTTALPRSKRPEAWKAINEFVAENELPTLTTYKARGVIPDSSPHFGGIYTGATIERALLEAADLVIGIGLDPIEMIPGPWDYAAKVVLINGWQIDGCTYFGDEALQWIGEFPELLPTIELPANERMLQGNHFARAAHKAVLAAMPDPGVGLAPQDVVRIARELTPDSSIATVDAGAHMLPALELWRTDAPGKVLISSGLATMGYALPAAIGASLVNPNSPTICFTGDGGLGMALGELETAVRLGLNLIVIVLDDAALSLIKVKQLPEGHGGDSAVHYSPINFAVVASGMGLSAERVENEDDFRAALEQALASPGPNLIDTVIDARAYPLILDAIRG